MYTKLIKMDNKNNKSVILINVILEKERIINYFMKNIVFNLIPSRAINMLLTILQ